MRLPPLNSASNSAQLWSPAKNRGLLRTQNQSCAEFDEDSESASGLAQLAFVVELEPFEGPAFICKPMGAPKL